MAPGPPNLEQNRFTLLDTTTKKKRKSTANFSEFPALPEIRSDNPRYITIEANNPTKPLNSYSCFALHRAILLISKEILTITSLRDGRLLLLVKDKTIANKFISTKALPGLCDITVKNHIQLNCVKGTIYAPFLNNVDPKEIVQELSSDGVVEAYKFKKIIDKKEVPTGVILLTFDLYNLPTNINVAWIKVRVQQFLPSPMRCRSCQSLGHTMKHCSRLPACVTCALPPHPSTDCSRVACVNCSDDHPSNSRDCPKFLQAKEILRIKTINKCSMGEATKIYRNQSSSTPPNTPSFAEIATSNKNKNNNNINIHYNENTKSNYDKNSKSYAKTINNDITEVSKPVSSKNTSYTTSNNKTITIPLSTKSSTININNNTIKSSISYLSQSNLPTANSIDSTTSSTSNNLLSDAQQTTPSHSILNESPLPKYSATSSIYKPHSPSPSVFSDEDMGD